MAEGGAIVLLSRLAVVDDEAAQTILAYELPLLLRQVGSGIEGKDHLLSKHTA
jgi:hypothetical protein